MKHTNRRARVHTDNVGAAAAQHSEYLVLMLNILLLRYFWLQSNVISIYVYL